MVRLSLQLRRPLVEVMHWPAWVLDTYAQFLRREPIVEERIENAIAQLTAVFASAHRREGAPPFTIADFLLYRDAWDQPPVDPGDDRYSDVDREIMRAMR